jgi:protein-tyrosine phosphatase
LFIDIHSHIIPGVDDGPETLDISLRMLRRAAATGIRAVVATPHVLDRPSPSWEQSVISRFQDLVEAVIAERLDIDIFLCSELFFQFGMEELVEWPIGSYRGMGVYSIVEPPMSHYPGSFEQVMNSLIARGKKMIFAHPERIHPLLGDIERIAALVRNGMLMQVSSGSLLGDFGRRVEAFAWKLLDNGLAHFIASDAHDPIDRTFNLEKAWNMVHDRCGREHAELLFFTNPFHVLFAEEVEYMQPVPFPGER